MKRVFCVILCLAIFLGTAGVANAAGETVNESALAGKTYFQSTAVIYGNDMSGIRWSIPSFLHFIDDTIGFFHVELVNGGYQDVDFTYYASGNTITLDANPEGIRGYSYFGSVTNHVVLEKNDDRLTVKSANVDTNSPSYSRYYSSYAMGFSDVGDVFISSSDNPSKWAQEEIENGIRLDLIPSRWFCDYRSNMTRGDFCMLALNTLCSFEGKYLYEILEERGIEVDESAFTDTDEYAILAACALGIVKGRGNGIFAPDDPITRQEAAVMLKQMADCAGTQPDFGDTLNYSDAGRIADWAKKQVIAVSRMIDSTINKAVMGGVGNNEFSPTTYYTREQSFLTMVRLYHYLQNPETAYDNGNHTATASADSIILSRSDFTLNNLGDTYQITATISPAGSNAILIWYSEDPTIATVDKNGTVTAVSQGVTIISVTAGSLREECVVRVKGGTPETKSGGYIKPYSIKYVKAAEGYNEEAGFGLNDFGEHVKWNIMIVMDERPSDTISVKASWCDSISDSRYFDDYGWKFAKAGNTHMRQFYLYGGDEWCIEIALPDDPGIEGDQWILLGANTRLEFSLEYLGDYSTGYGWELKMISYEFSNGDLIVVGG